MSDQDTQYLEAFGSWLKRLSEDAGLLADVLSNRELPESTRRPVGGALNYRDPERAEHNFRLDPAAANTLITKGKLPKLVLSDTTFTPEIEITKGSEVWCKLSAPEAPAWAKLVDTGHPAGRNIGSPRRCRSNARSMSRRSSAVSAGNGARPQVFRSTPCFISTYFMRTR